MRKELYDMINKLFKEITDSEGRTYDAIKKIEKIQAEIRDRILYYGTT